MAREVPDNAILLPLPGRVVIRVEANPEQKYGSLYLPQRGKGDQTFGTVEAVYEAYEDDAGRLILPLLAKGDLVLFGKYTGTEVQLNRETYIICKETDVLSRVVDADTKAFDEDDLPF